MTEPIDLVPAQVRELEATIRRRCRDSDAQLVAFCVDLGMSKRRSEDYPALSYFRAGKADALLIVCVPSDEPPPRGELLTSRALSGFPGAWLAVPRLREVGLLPAAIGSRGVAAQCAAALRERRFPCDVIAHWLDAEGHAAPNTEPGHWTRSDVLKLSWTGPTDRVGTGGTDPLTEFILTMRSVSCGRGQRQSRASELRSSLRAP